MKWSMVQTVYQCLTCGQTFHSWSEPDAVYGIDHLYTPDGDIGIWKALLDPCFKEIYTLVDEAMGIPQSYSAFRSVWGICCDKAPNGATFNATPYCPHDRSDQVKFIDKPTPYIFEDKDVIPITFEGWTRLTQAQKTELVVSGLKQNKFIAD